MKTCQVRVFVCILQKVRTLTECRDTGTKRLSLTQTCGWSELFVPLTNLLTYLLTDSPLLTASGYTAFLPELTMCG